MNTILYIKKYTTLFSSKINNIINIFFNIKKRWIKINIQLSNKLILTKIFNYNLYNNDNYDFIYCFLLFFY